MRLQKQELANARKIWGDALIAISKAYEKTALRQQRTGKWRFRCCLRL